MLSAGISQPNRCQVTVANRSTPGTRILGPISKLHKWQNFVTGGLFQYTDIVSHLNNCMAASREGSGSTLAGCLHVFKAVAEIQAPVALAIRHGDILPAASDDTKARIHINMTILVAVFQLLLFALEGPDSNMPRFQRDTTAKDNFFGFTPDQWQAALFAYNFYQTRRDGKKNITGSPKAPEAKGLVIPRLALAEHKTVLAEDEAHLVPSVAYAIQSIDFADICISNAAAAKSFVQECQAKDELAAHESLERGIANRMQFFDGLGQKKVLSKKNVGSSNSQTPLNERIKLPPRDLVDIGSMEHVVKTGKKHFGPFHEFKSDQGALQAIAKHQVLDKAALQSYVAGCDAYVERQIALKYQFQDGEMASDEAREALRRLAEHQYYLSHLSNKWQPSRDTFVQDCKFFGFELSD